MGWDEGTLQVSLSFFILKLKEFACPNNILIFALKY